LVQALAKIHPSGEVADNDIGTMMETIILPMVF
jgi:hypothetical protein